MTRVVLIARDENLVFKVGRIDVDHPRVTGHRGPVVDLKFNPFNEHEIGSCSDDGTVKIWSIPDDGLKLDMYQWKVDLHGHQRRVDYIEWHPTVENLILSAGLDHQIILWNVERAEPIQIYRCHPEAIQSIAWNRNGSLFATSCKDKHLRVIDARSGRIISVNSLVDVEYIDRVLFVCSICRKEWAIQVLKHPKCSSWLTPIVCCRQATASNSNDK
jgi:WD40 repeat protein